MSHAATHTPEVSHGRGGAGNILADGTQYVDGEIVRAGVAGSHNDGAFSTGRGGTGNIGDAGVRHSTEGRADKTVVPEAAVRPSADLSDYHTGRGGAGNEHLGPEHEKKHKEKEAKENGVNVGLADKLKKKLTHLFK